MVGKRIDLTGKDVVEVRVVVLVATPSPSRSVRMRSSDATVTLSPGPVPVEEGSVQNVMILILWRKLPPADIV